MNSPVIPLVASSVLSAPLPGWVLPWGREPDALTAALTAGIALKSREDLVRSQSVWDGCWRARGPQMRRHRGPADGTQRGRGDAARCACAHRRR